jgi:hypothetical protein
VKRPGFSSDAGSERPELAPLDPSTPWARRAQHPKTATMNGSLHE